MRFDAANVVWIDGVAFAPNHPRVLSRLFKEADHCSKELDKCDSAKLEQLTDTAKSLIKYGKNKTKDDAQPVGGLRNPECQPDTVPALDHSPKTHRSSKRGVGICVKIISFRRRATDLDNVIYGSKALRDSIARSLALDDGDRRIKWEYDTVITSGALGTQVLISKLK